MLVIYFLCWFMMASTFGIQVPAIGYNSLRNKHLKVAAEIWNPFMIFYCNEIEMDYTDECSDKGNMTYGGALWDLLKLIKQARNVTFSIVRPPTYSWGYCYGANNCTGMIGMVNRGEVDFAIGIILCHLTKKRLSILEISSRSFHTNPEPGTSCKIYHTNWSNGLLHHNCSADIPGQFVVYHRSIIVQCLDLFLDLYSCIYYGNNCIELSF